MIISCEGEKVRSPVHKDCLNPEFDVKALFFRKKPREHIHIQVQEYGVRFIIEAVQDESRSAAGNTMAC